MRIITSIFCALLTVIPTVAQTSPKTISLTKSEQEQVASNNDFAFRLFREARENRNTVLSPLSITYALGMLNNGAAGQTLNEINNVLGFTDVDATNAFCRKMLSESGHVDKETKILIANTIYVNEARGYQLLPAFVEKAYTYYDAQPETRDFNDGLTLGVINQWAKEHTEGLIPEILSEDLFDPMTISYLLNALYFKGTWSMPFQEEMTRQEKFEGYTKKVDVQMMQQCESFRYAENDICQAIQLPYGNGGYRMTVFLPREGKNLDDLLAKLNGQNWLDMNYAWQEVALGLPRFESDADIDLVPVMKALGMPSAFDSEYAEFPNFCGNEQDPHHPVYIDLMKQVAKIKVDENGTEAAAVTIIGMKDNAMPSEPIKFHANRPFLYIISEQSTGVIFFIGQYTGPEGASQIGGHSTFIQKPMTDKASVGETYDLQGRKTQSESLKKGVYIVDGKKVVVK